MNDSHNNSIDNSIDPLYQQTAQQLQNTQALLKVLQSQSQIGYYDQNENPLDDDFSEQINQILKGQGLNSNNNQFQKSYNTKEERDKSLVERYAQRDQSFPRQSSDKYSRKYFRSQQPHNPQQESDSVKEDGLEEKSNIGRSSKNLIQRVCKVCLDEENQNQLISPCRCQGTQLYIHMECLKTWLVSQQKELFDARCEICKTQYRQQIEYEICTDLKRICEPHRRNKLFGIIFLAFLGIGIIIALYFFAASLSGNSQKKDSSNQNVFLVITLTILSLFLIILAVMMRLIILEMIQYKKISKWIIKDYELKDRKQDDFYLREGKIRIIKISSHPLFLNLEKERPSIQPKKLLTGKSDPMLPANLLNNTLIGREFILKKGETGKSVDVLMEIKEQDLRQLENYGVIKLSQLQAHRRPRVIPADNALENLNQLFQNANENNA